MLKLSRHTLTSTDSRYKDQVVFSYQNLLKKLLNRFLNSFYVYLFLCVRVHVCVCVSLCVSGLFLLKLILFVVLEVLLSLSNSNSYQGSYFFSYIMFQALIVNIVFYLGVGCWSFLSHCLGLLLFLLSFYFQAHFDFLTLSLI